MPPNTLAMVNALDELGQENARLRAERDALYRLCLTMYSAHHIQSVVDAALKEGK